MKHSPEPNQPDRPSGDRKGPDAAGSAHDGSPAFGHGVHSSSADPESRGFSGDDAEIARAEEELFSALGRLPEEAQGDENGDALATPGDGSPNRNFEASLRERFLSAAGKAADSSSSAGASADGTTMNKLQSWVPQPPRAEFERDLRASFLDVAALRGSPVSDGSGGRASSSQQAVQSAGHRSHTPRQQRGVNRRAGAAPPTPARASRKNSSLRLVGVGTLLAAAAAVVIFLQRPSDVVGSGDEVPASGGPAEVIADAGGEDASDTAEAGSILEPDWELDTTFGDPEALLASVRIDGTPVASAEDFQMRMASAELVESSGFELRLRHREEFVIELAEDTAIRLNAFRPEAESEAAVIRADFGSIRVATGPDFDPSSPLVVETPHVRTKVVGTVYGLDIGDGYTCVCCLEGAVETTPMQPAHAGFLVAAGKTSVVEQAKDRPPVPPVALVGAHREPLERLSEYWA